MKTYVTFGQIHRHEVEGLGIFDRDCVARLECDSAVDGRARAFRLFGPVFAFEYHEDEWHGSMQHFPRGYIDVPREVTDSITEDTSDDTQDDY